MYIGGCRSPSRLNRIWLNCICLTFLWFTTVDKAFTVLRGDVIGSRMVTDKEDLLQKLLEGVAFLNRSLEGWIVTPFRVIGGNGLQGVLSSPIPLPRILIGLKAKVHPYHLRVGIGLGS